MTYKLLSRESMVSLSATLVDESHEDCRALKADTVGAALWPHIVEVHENLLGMQRIGPAPERLQQIMKLGAHYDARHDDVIRAIWNLCHCAELLREQPEAKQEVRRLRDRLLPDKLVAITRSYRDEAGQAKLVESRLTAADWTLMQTLHAPDGRTLADLVRDWFALAARLGELEHERTGDTARKQPTLAEILAARNAWIRAMRTLRHALELRASLPHTLHTILRRIDEVVEQAARRRQGQAGGDSADSGIDPEPPDSAPASASHTPALPALTSPASTSDTARAPAAPA